VEKRLERPERRDLRAEAGDLRTEAGKNLNLREET
jgi:hypothetical protein